MGRISFEERRKFVGKRRSEAATRPFVEKDGQGLNTSFLFLCAIAYSYKGHYHAYLCASFNRSSQHINHYLSDMIN